MRTDRALYENWRSGACVHEREHLYQHDSAYRAFINFKLIDNELWLPGKTGCLVTQLDPSDAEAIVSDR